MPDIGGIGFPKQPYVMFGSMPTPGVAFIRNLERVYSWDAPEVYGAAGSPSKFKGVPLAKFDVEVQMWDPKQWALWEAFATFILRPPLVPGTGAIGVFHPILAAAPWQVKDCTILGITQPVQSDLGGWTVVIKCLEWKRYVPLPVSRPIAAIPPVEVPVPTAKDAAEVAMETVKAQTKGAK
jgi:hypothetical protein